MYAGLAALDDAVPEWLKNVKAGDVLRQPNGILRVVRRVSYKRGVISACYFTIRHCSWTGACYTIKARSEMFGWTHTGKSVKLSRRLDRAILRDFGKNGDERRLTCCSVEGVA